MPSESELLQQFVANREGLDELIRRRFIIAPSFEIYGGYGGLFDYGPLACALRNRIKDIWTQHFVVHDGMFELDASVITPEPILKASGHVDRFCDLMVATIDKEGRKQCFRADHVVEEGCDRILADATTTPELAARCRDILVHVEEYKPAEIDEVIAELKLTGPEGLAYTKAYPYNLMFQTELDPSTQVRSYLRPETAQGIFTNFKRFLTFNGGRLPFAVAQQGRSYRNEIAPRAGLLRVREFEQFEIEHFCDYESAETVAANDGRTGLIPDHMMEIVADTVLTFNDKHRNGTVDLTIREAWDRGMIRNQTLLYYIGRVAQFLYSLGIRRDCIRFDQHTDKQLAHYARDCWDAMVYCSYKWTECVGIADRSAYDLDCHSKATGENLTAFHPYGENEIVHKLELTLNAGKLGPAFRKDAKAVAAAVEAAANCQETLAAWYAKYQAGEAFTVVADERAFEIKPEMVKKFVSARQTGVAFTPQVVEPSFGLGRILHCLLEHSYAVREATNNNVSDLDRAYFAFNPLVAPYKAAVLPLLSDNKSVEMTHLIRNRLARAGISAKADAAGSAAIGKRYARLDELGIPFAITVDPRTLEDGSVTIRERDTMRQVRVHSIDEAVQGIADLASTRTTWDELVAVHGLIE